MKHVKIVFAIPAVLAFTAALSGCDKPTVVNVPATPVAVPGPAGPAGAQGNQGKDGTKGETGKPGDSTTVIVVPPEPAPVPPKN